MIDAEGMSRIFTVRGHLQLRNVLLTGGRITEERDSPIYAFINPVWLPMLAGGGILAVDGASVVVEQSKISNCTVATGDGTVVSRTLRVA